MPVVACLCFATCTALRCDGYDDRQDNKNCRAVILLQSAKFPQRVIVHAT